MISVMIPTRGRPEMLFDSVTSLVNKARKPNNLEIILGIDKDDEDTIKMADKLPVRTIFFPERHGYEHLNEYYNTLAAVSNGDWIMMYGDDCIMLTEDWDLEFDKHNPEELIYANGTHTSSTNFCFPAISRAWYEAMGQISNHWANDTWLTSAAAHWPGVKNVSLTFLIQHKLVYDYKKLDCPGENFDSIVAGWVKERLDEHIDDRSG